MTGLATLPEASAYVARGGGGGARPTSPSLLAARAFNAATGDDQEMALKLYDYGVENYGDDFVLAYNTIRDDRALGSADVTPDKPGTLRRVSETLDTGGPGRSKAGTAAHALPEPPIANLNPGQTSAGTAAGAVPDPPYRPANTSAGTAEGAVPNVYHPTPLAGTAAGAVPNVVGPSTTSAGTSEGAVPNVIRPSTNAGTSEGAVPNVYHPSTNAGTSEGAVPNVYGPSTTRAGTSEGAVPNVYHPSTNAGTSAGAVPNVEGGLRSVRGPMTTAAGTYAGQIRLDSPEVATDTPPPSPSGRYGKQPDGSYRDYPPGGEVELPEDTVTMVAGTGLPARMANDPRIEPGDPRYNGKGKSGIPKPDRQLAAPPGSGGLADAVVPPPPAPPQASGPPIPLTPPTAAPTAPPAAAGPPTPTPVADDSGFMSKPDIWSFLTSAGLGAMASGSTSALGAIGAGGTAGINQIGVLRKDQRERAKNLADAEFQKNRIAVSREAEAGQMTRHGQTIGSNEKIATLQDKGATDRTGMTNQTTRDVATLQDQGATTRTGMTNQTTKDVAVLQDQGATNRTGMTNQTTKDVATLQDQGATGRTTQTNQTNKDISQGNNDEQLKRQQDAQQHATNQALLKDQLDRDYLPYKLEQERNGVVLGKEDLRNFYIKGGATPEEANEWSAGFHDTDKKASELTKDEFVQALDGAATNLGGGDGLTGKQMMEMLSSRPDIAAEIYAELGKTGNSGNGASVVMGVLTKHGITYENPYFGSPRLVFKSAPAKAPTPAPAPGGGGGGGGGARKYDPATGKLVSVQ